MNNLPGSSSLSDGTITTTTTTTKTKTTSVVWYGVVKRGKPRAVTYTPVLPCPATHTNHYTTLHYTPLTYVPLYLNQPNLTPRRSVRMQHTPRNPTTYIPHLAACVRTYVLPPPLSPRRARRSVSSLVWRRATDGRGRE
jgi:hypothetical protein